MWILALIPFTLQGAAILVDEIIFHRKRGLPLWERIGHPLDTLSLFACYLFVLLVPFSSASVKGYIALAVFSCLMVTKDEFVHKHHCPWEENWLHALLFLLHPITLIVIGVAWPAIDGTEATPWFAAWAGNDGTLRFALTMQAGAIFAFGLYQTIFWNILWKGKKVP